MAIQHFKIEPADPDVWGQLTTHEILETVRTKVSPIDSLKAVGMIRDLIPDANTLTVRAILDGSYRENKDSSVSVFIHVPDKMPKRQKMNSNDICRHGVRTRHCRIC